MALNTALRTAEHHHVPESTDREKIAIDSKANESYSQELISMILLFPTKNIASLQTIISY